LCVKNGTIVNHDGMYEADILVEEGIITKLEQGISPPEGAQVIDAQGKLIFPGGVDCDCRFLNPSDEIPVADEFKSASLAALCGGTTTIVNEVPVCPGDSLLNTYETFLSTISKEICCDYALCVSVPNFDADVAAQMETLATEKHVASFYLRLCTGNRTSNFLGLNEDSFLEALRTCSSLGVLPSVPACANPVISSRLAEQVAAEFPTLGPEGSLWASPERLEADTVNRVALLASNADFVCPVLMARVHSQAALDALVDQRRQGSSLLFGQTSAAALAGISATTETPAGVRQTDWAKAASCISDPPIRPDAETAHRLLKHLASGDLTAIGSAHRAVSGAVRAALGLRDFRRIPSGVATVGSRLAVLWKCAVEQQAVMDPCAFVACMSSNSARLFNLYPRKGRIEKGSDADLVVWNSAVGKRDNEDRAGLLPDGVIDPFEGLELSTCAPDVVVLRGRIVVQHGRPVDSSVEPGSGLLLAPEPFGTFTFGRAETVKRSRESALKAVPREAYTGPVLSLNGHEKTPPRESYYYRKEAYDNVPKAKLLPLSLPEALPPGQRIIHTSVKTAHPPGGTANAFWWDR
uniref:dihydropyrimidinase n=1 Tax=Schistocephalus solidus TaxID=70667 RepID=A0A183TBN8_SCHSO